MRDVTGTSNLFGSRNSDRNLGIRGDGGGCLLNFPSVSSGDSFSSTQSP